MDGVLFQKTLWSGSLVLATCGILHWLVAHAFSRYSAAYKTQPGFLPKKGDIPRDFFWASITLFVFGSINLPLATWLHAQRALFLSYEVRENWLQFLGSLALFFFALDAIRYWSHRALHTPLLFRYVHRVHHRSITPTTFSGFSSHPVETTINMITPLLVMAIFPVHYIVPITYAWFITVGHILRHLGYDFLSHHLERVPLLRSLVLARFHDYHHTDPDTNFTSMFSWWDYWMGTAHEKCRRPRSQKSI